MPFLLQVLAYAQQSRERSNYEQAALVERMQEFKRQIDRESRWSPNGMNDSPNGDGIQAIGRSSHKMIEAAMQSASKGKVAYTGGIRRQYSRMHGCGIPTRGMHFILKVTNFRFRPFDKVIFPRGLQT